MEAFSFVKFWKSTRNTRRHSTLSDSISGASSSSSSWSSSFSSVLRNPLDSDNEDLGEEDDSFFELDISVLCNKDNRHEGKSRATPISVSPGDHFSKNQVIPVMVESKPRSPVGPLQTGSKFRAFSFKLSKSTEKSINCMSTLSFRKTASSLKLKHTNDTFSEDSLFSFKLSKSTEKSIPGHSTMSFRKTASSLKLQKKNDMLSEDSLSSSSSKRFLSLYPRPKGSKKQSNKGENVTSVNSRGQKVTRKQLGKSRTSAVVEPASPASRRDESLLIQSDGIQSAILHCKRSFHCSRESSLLSRYNSDSSSPEKLSSTSSEDSYEFSPIASDSSTERSVGSEKTFGSWK